eukprot:TRINITY_DN2721_c0_g1_i1.p1 TRINITY_DN2721_c0_g1~~TRINITY_DN2721_c0_g1_i1.p1  ORF type:complete len:113 (+),score=15.74 TRINITY_DN2721_c0_g1_i1:150-488(+)
MKFEYDSGEEYEKRFEETVSGSASKTEQLKVLIARVDEFGNVFNRNSKNYTLEATQLDPLGGDRYSFETYCRFKSDPHSLKHGMSGEIILRDPEQHIWEVLSLHSHSLKHRE